MKTIPNREKPLLLGKGTLLVSCPRNRQLTLAETMLGREAETWSDGVEVSPPSNVIIRVQSSLIREGPLLPPVVRRCPVGNGVIQRQRTGRVASVGAARLERDAWARLLQGSGKLVSVLGVCRALSGWHRAVRNDERADG